VVVFLIFEWTLIDKRGKPKEKHCTEFSNSAAVPSGTDGIFTQQKCSSIFFMLQIIVLI
jgi:hypothetical protein